MSLSEILNSTALDSSKAVEIEKLADLVEAQIDNVLGGGYSQYAAYHAKDAQNLGGGGG
jgi:hypothetical protein